MKLCEERQALWQRYIRNLRAYGVAVANMEAAIYLPDFFQAYTSAEECRERLLDARAAFDEHTAGHGCNLPDAFERLSHNRNCRDRTAPGKRRIWVKAAGK